MTTLAELLEACEQWSTESHLQPIHMAAELPPGDLPTVLRAYARESCGYHGAGDLVLRPIADWRAEVLPLFSAGFGPARPDEDGAAELRAQIAASIEALVGADARAFYLGSSDSHGAPLTPTGGLHTYLVLDSATCRLLVDLDWDS